MRPPPRPLPPPPSPFSVLLPPPPPPTSSLPLPLAPPPSLPPAGPDPSVPSSKIVSTFVKHSELITSSLRPGFHLIGAYQPVGVSLPKSHYQFRVRPVDEAPHFRSGLGNFSLPVPGSQHAVGHPVQFRALVRAAASPREQGDTRQHRPPDGVVACLV